MNSYAPKELLQLKNYILAIALASIFSSCDSQNEELEKAKSELEESIETMQSELVFYLAEGIYNPSISNTSKGTGPKKSDSLLMKKLMNHYLDSIVFNEEIKYPTNYLELDYDKGDLGKTLGDRDRFFKNKDLEPIFVLNNIIYKDKSSETLADTISYSPAHSLYKSLTINSSKPVDKLVVKVLYKYPEVTKIRVAKENLIINLPEGEIRLKELEGNFISYTIPISLKNKLVDVIAYDIDGQPIKINRYSYVDALTSEQISYLEKLIPVQKEALEKLNNHVFENVSALNTYIHNKTPPEPNFEVKEFIASYSFDYDIAFADLFFQKGEKMFAEHNIVIENDNYNQTKLAFFKAKDTTSQKQGFIGLDGAWIKQPQFNGLRYENDYYYSAGGFNDSIVLLHLNSTEKSFEIVNYKLDERELFNGDLAIIKNIYEERGIINAETNQMVLPFKYDFLKEEGGLFIVRKEGRFGVYDFKMKQILPEIYTNIDISEGKIYTQFREDISSNVYSSSDIIEKYFSLKGKELK